MLISKDDKTKIRLNYKVLNFRLPCRMTGYTLLNDGVYHVVLGAPSVLTDWGARGPMDPRTFSSERKFRG